MRLHSNKIPNHGGYSEGLTRLWEEKRLNISMEATVLQEPWQALFTEDEQTTSSSKGKKLDTNSIIGEF